MELVIDHVTVAGQRIEALASAFAAAGVTAEYGGLHSNGITHMSLLGFNDGSYIELVSLHRPGEVSPWWHQHVVRDGGPCAWAVRCEDLDAEAARLRALGIAVDGPRQMSRMRADRVSVQWELAFVGGHGPGAEYPFLIRDRTPRENRVRPSASVAGSELLGVDTVVLAVADVVAAADAYRRAYDLRDPEPWASADFPGPMLRFPDTPLALIAPGHDGDWIADRLKRFGPGPCAFLIGSRDFDHSLERLPMDAVSAWGRRRLAWFASDAMRRLRVGVVGH